MTAAEKELMDIAEDLINTIKDACPHLYYMDKYVRERKQGCPGSESFKYGINSLEGVLKRTIPIYERRKVEQKQAP